MKFEPKPCRNCGETFEPVRSTNIYCSKKCKGQSDQKRQQAKQAVARKLRRKQYDELYNKLEQKFEEMIESGNYREYKLQRNSDTRYIISRDGETWSLNHNRNRARSNAVEVVHKPAMNKLKVYTHKVGYQFNSLGPIHRRVLEVWGPPQPTADRCETDHIDRDKTNNHIDNLRWVNKEENMANVDWPAITKKIQETKLKNKLKNTITSVQKTEEMNK